MRGQKYGEETRQRAFALLETGESVSAVARTLGVPRTTLKGWLDRRSEAEEADMEALHRRNKERFASDAWRTIHAGSTLLVHRFERALRNEAELDRLLSELLRGTEELSAEQTRALVKQFQELKLMDVGKIAVVLGTLYDKQALIAKEAMARVELTDVRFEDL